MLDEIEFKIEYEVEAESGRVIATIPELNHISSFGKSFAEAESNVKEAALGYLEVLLKEHRELPRSAHRSEGTYLKLFVPKSA